MSRRKPRSPGVSLQGRAAGLHRYDDEIKSDGGKKHLHSRIRQSAKRALRRELACGQDTL
ncbi:hypothetical protein [Streptomyces beijiangensis]|uniref:Uncharacterized protein n=1 Tax=Streptomyces beijiangensis TaxID=163361 RepID=A0A939FC30_9ACTN|nr:hypothetical protein [Streptomyces beijiangensis]MBO0515471.1 hypothetical protein [Streptomyces beijiangensis]